MKTIERICSHDILFDYASNSKNAVPDQTEIEHVTDLLIENYTNGELCLNTVIKGREYEFRGWWSIVRPS